jgi:hypothetical protein
MTRAVRDVNVQKKGICGIGYAPGTSILGPPGLNRSIVEFVIEMQAIANSVPFRYSGGHFCHDDRRVNFLVQAIRVAAPT